MVVLIIRTPNQEVMDHQIECDSEWTILEVKEYLERRYPTKPAVECQRLIYSGHLLLNHLKLKNVLRNYADNEPHIVHLVCASSTSAPASPYNGSQSPSTAGIQHPSVTPQTSTVPSPAAFDGTRPILGFPAIQPNQYSYYIPWFHAASTMQNADQQQALANHMAGMQQAYLQFMNDYCLYCNQLGHPVPDFLAAGSVPAAAAAEIPPTQQDVPAPEIAPVPAPPPVEAPEPEPVIPVAAGVVREDEEPVRDALDWMYLFSRAFILFSIVYLYSSLTRFFLVAVFGLLLYLYQVGFFRMFNNPAEQNPNEADRALGPQNEQNRRADAANEDVQRREPPQGVSENHDVHQPVERSFLSTSLAVAWTFVSSFFTSLIPPQH